MLDQKIVNKIKNANKRFRQGRTSYKKLRTIVNTELGKYKKELDLAKEALDRGEARLDALEAAIEPHVHDDNCHHIIKHGEDEVEIEPHVHGESCHH